MVMAERGGQEWTKMRNWCVHRCLQEPDLEWTSGRRGRGDDAATAGDDDGDCDVMVMNRIELMLILSIGNHQSLSKREVCLGVFLRFLSSDHSSSLAWGIATNESSNQFNSTPTHAFFLLMEWNAI
uniref:Uncharacterized protein n=1 Tax=Globodera rostochiensis TaxID=31243 RepID=A0A914HE78_GLORO